MVKFPGAKVAVFPIIYIILGDIMIDKDTHAALRHMLKEAMTGKKVMTPKDKKLVNSFSEHAEGCKI